MSGDEVITIQSAASTAMIAVSVAARAHAAWPECKISARASGVIVGVATGLLLSMVVNAAIYFTLTS